MLLECHFDQACFVAIVGYGDDLGTTGALVQPTRDLLAGAGHPNLDSARISQIHRVRLKLQGSLKVQISVRNAQMGR